MPVSEHLRGDPARAASVARRLVLHHRYAPWRWLMALFVAVAMAVRLVLLASVASDVSSSGPHLLQVFGIGLVFDLVTAGCLFIPLVLYLAFLPDRWFRHGAGRLALLAGSCGWVGLLYLLAVAEWVFWDEFGTRFNFIAVDYLVYTHEVIGNIRASYALPPIFAALAAGTVITVGLGRRRLLAACAGPSPLRERLVAAAPLVLVPVVAALALHSGMKDLSANRYVNALSGNGIFEFFAAWRAAELDFPTFYRTIGRDEAYARVRRMLPTSRAQLASGQPHDLSRVVVADGQPRQLNVVLVSVESLSAEFLGVLGNRDGLTPALDVLAAQGRLFTNLYATGNRTVRGLEALSLSIPPTPGESIVKRPGNAGLTTIGRVLGEAGYDVRFVYGGYSYFDNMRDFFGANGYEVVDRTAIAPERIHHETVWGVADEDLYTRALEAIDASHAQGRPSFTHVMTTSNHRPYTYPDGRIDLPSGSGRPGAVKYTDWAIGDFMARARTRPWYRDTLFVIVADHCASSAGKVDLPLNRYRIPLILYAPGIVEPFRDDRLASQIDVVPTILGLLRLDYTAPFLGRDLLDGDPYEGRAFIATYQELGYLRGGRLVELDSRRGVRVTVPDALGAGATPARHDSEMEHDAIAWYEVASDAYRRGALRRFAVGRTDRLHAGR